MSITHVIIMLCIVNCNKGIVVITTNYITVDALQFHLPLGSTIYLSVPLV